MICTFDISGMIQKFKKRQMDARPRNEVDAISEKMKFLETPDSEIWDMILKLSEIDLCGYDGRTPLIHACIYRRFALTKRLIKLGADVNRQDSTKKSPLHCAVINGELEIVALLINHKAKVNLQDQRGFTALDFANGNFAKLQQEQFEELVNLLILHGAKTRDEISNTMTEDGQFC